MKKLPNIKLTAKQFLSLYDAPSFDYGGESNIYQIPELFGEDTLAKIWTCDIPPYVIDNKFQKIKLLYQNEQLEQINDVKILASISYGKNIVGYTMTRSYFRSLDFICTSREDQLRILIQIKEKLKQFETLGILYGDVSAGNILVGSQDVCFCDLDNVAYQGYDMDYYSASLQQFIDCYGKINFDIVSYAFNYLVLRQLCSLDTNEKVTDYLKTEQIPEEIEAESYQKIKKQMNNACSYEGLYLTDYIKPEYQPLI